MFDVVIIGSGIIGASIAQYLSKFCLNALVLEAEEEASQGTSKANSGIVHAGYDAEPGTLKARFNVMGNEMYSKLSKELNIPFKRNGALVLCFSKEDVKKLEKLYDQGIKNKVPSISILDKSEVKNIEPNVSDNVYKALYAPTSGIISPYEATLAFAENAYINGVKFWFNCKVHNIFKKEDHYILNTEKGEVSAKVVVNAAGLFSDEISSFISKKKYTIVPRRGEYLLTDKFEIPYVSKTLFQLPSSMGKGVLVTPTVHDGLLIGPSSEDIIDKIDFDTNREILEKVMNTASRSVQDLPLSNIITSFSGLRANIKNEEDFVVEKVEGENFINAVGINSPGLSSAPSIAKYISDIILDILSPKENANFNPYRNPIKIFKELNLEDKNELIKANKAYGHIVCRCETITEGEIVDAIRRPLGAKTLDGIKRRTRAGMGRCQGGFCTSRVMEIMCRELNLSPLEITKFGRESKLIMGFPKDNL